MGGIAVDFEEQLLCCKGQLSAVYPDSVTFDAPGLSVIVRSAADAYSSAANQTRSFMQIPSYSGNESL